MRNKKEKARAQTVKPKPYMAVYAVTETGGAKNKKGKFTRCGAGFLNEKDGSLTVLLNHIPYTNKLQVRAPKEQEACWKAIHHGRYEVYDPADEENGTNFWTLVGSAFGNVDASLNIYLDLIPNSRRLNIRLPKEVS